MDDAPAARVGAERHGEGAGDLDPDRDRRTCSIWPLANSASAMMPIVFWASLAPCEKAMNPAEMGCRRRNQRLTGACGALAHQPDEAGHEQPGADEARGAASRSSGRMILSTTPLQMTPPTPALAIMAPMRPPKSACDELDGMPKYQVMRFQTTAPTRAARTTGSVTRSVLTMPFADGLGDARGDEGAEQVEAGRHEDGDARRQGARRHRGRDRVGGVVEAVGVVEDERQDDDRDEEDHGLGSGQLCLRTMLSMTLATCSHSSMAALEGLVDVFPLDDVGALHVAVEEAGRWRRAGCGRRRSRGC